MTDSTIEQMPNVDPLKNENQNRYRSIIREFSLNTSTHGIPGIARSQTIPNCLFWTVSFLIFIGITCYFVTNAIINYFQYPTETLVTITEGWPQVFPAVTICNYSPFRSDKFMKPFLNYLNEYHSINITNKTIFDEKESVYIDHYLQYQLNQNESSLNQYFYSLESMLIKCNYNGLNCSSNDFIPFLSSKYGFCYTFNSETDHINNGSVHLNNENGQSGQLQLDLYLHSHQYLPFITDGVGIVTMVHENTQLPLVDRVGVNLIPGRKHKIGYSKKTTRFLPSPYTTCTNQINAGMKAMFEQFSDAKYDYSQEICFKVAIQIYTYDQCGCISPYEWTSRHIILPSTTNVIDSPLCNITDECYSKAVKEFQSNSSIASTVAGDCRLECSTNEFLITISSIISPPKWYFNSIKQFVELSEISLPDNWNLTWMNEIEKNYVGINVVCETTRIESFTQQATLNPIDLLSNIGGQTGLWIGISFLSLFEIFEMLFRLFRHQFYHLRNICHQQ